LSIIQSGSTNKCLGKGVVPKYAIVKIPGTTGAARRTKLQAEKLRIKNEINDFYEKINAPNNKTEKLVFSTQRTTKL
jgi:hypothetical protein